MRGIPTRTSHFLFWHRYNTTCIALTPLSIKRIYCCHKTGVYASSRIISLFLTLLRLMLQPLYLTAIHNKIYALKYSRHLLLLSLTCIQVNTVKVSVDYIKTSTIYNNNGLMVALIKPLFCNMVSFY